MLLRQKHETFCDSLSREARAILPQGGRSSSIDPVRTWTHTAKRTLHRSLSRVVMGACLMAGMVSTSAANAEIEASGVLGWRWLSHDAELGRFLDDPKETALQDAVMLGLRLGWLPWERFGFESELTAMPTGSVDERASVVVIGTRLQAVFNVLTGKVRPFLAAGSGFSFASTSNPIWVLTDADLELHVGAGCRVDIGADWGVRADLRVVVGPGQDLKAAYSPEFAVSLYGRFPWEAPVAAGTYDKDSDGVIDSADKCPDEAGAVTREGCPGAEKADAQVDAERAEKAEELAESATPSAAPAAPEPGRTP